MKNKVEGLISTKSNSSILVEPLSDEAISACAHAINAITRDSVIAMMIAIGDTVVTRFCHSDFEQWKARGTGDLSLRKLANHESLKISPAALYRAMGIYELERTLGVSTRKHLTASHLRSVLGLPPKQQVRLLREAEQQSWTSRELEAAAKRARKKKNEKRGRPTLPRFVRTVRRFGKLLGQADEAFGDLDAVDELDRAEARRLYKAVTEMRDKMEELEIKLANSANGQFLRGA
jgi:hypothetical protein